MADETYVTNADWMAVPGRPDAIDVVADEFERPSGAAAFWDDVTARRMIHASTFAPRTIERRAG